MKDTASLNRVIIQFPPFHQELWMVVPFHIRNRHCIFYKSSDFLMRRMENKGIPYPSIRKRGFVGKIEFKWLRDIWTVWSTSNIDLWSALQAVTFPEENRHKIVESDRSSYCYERVWHIGLDRFDQQSQTCTISQFS